MAQDNDEMHEVIKEVQTTNRFILKRLNQFMNEKSVCSCNTEITSEIVNLQKRVQQLHDKEIERDKEMNDLKTQLHSLKSALDNALQSQSLPDLHGGKGPFPLQLKSAFEIPDIYSYHVSMDHYKHEISPSDPTNTDSDNTCESDTNSGTNENSAKCSGRSMSPQEIQARAIETESTNTSNFVSQSEKDSDNKTTRVRFKDKNEVIEVGRSDTATNTIVDYKSGTKVRVIEQTEKRIVNPIHWDLAANQERIQGLPGLQTLKAILSVVCVDVSYSMSKDNAWEQACIFFGGMIEGLKESMTQYNVTEESVALVTFGHQTCVVKRLTKDFTALKNTFDGLSLGGPSPMCAGLLLSTAAVTTPISSSVNGLTVYTKLVLITDGYPTDTFLAAGPDEATPSERDETYSRILEIMTKMERQFEVIIVPVGKPNMDFLELMKSCSDGRIVTHKHGKKIGQRLRKTLQAGTRRGGLPYPYALNITDSDEEDIREILENSEKWDKKMTDSKYNEVISNDLPTIGARVRRGPDWQYGDQDSGGPGTVVGHAYDSEGVWVEWDKNCKINVYHYCRGNYDVLIVDEPRMPKADGRLAVGCVVKPGPDWKQTTRNVRVSDKGVVIRIFGEDKVNVRWDYNKKGDYTHSLSGVFEVEFCPSNDVTLEAAGYTMQGSSQTYAKGKFRAQATSKPVKNKNKNKNL